MQLCRLIVQADFEPVSIDEIHLHNLGSSVTQVVFFRPSLGSKPRLRLGFAQNIFSLGREPKPAQSHGLGPNRPLLSVTETGC